MLLAQRPLKLMLSRNLGAPESPPHDLVDRMVAEAPTTASRFFLHHVLRRFGRPVPREEAPDEETPSAVLALLPPLSSGKPREDWKWRPVRDVSLSDDTLILLSLMSPELEKKVESYRATLSEDERQAWDERRSVLRKWLEAGHLLEPET